MRQLALVVSNASRKPIERFIFEVDPLGRWEEKRSPEVRCIGCLGYRFQYPLARSHSAIEFMLTCAIYSDVITLQQRP